MTAWYYNMVQALHKGVKMKANWKLLPDVGMYIARVRWGTKDVFATGRTLQLLSRNIKQNCHNNGVEGAVSLDIEPSNDIEVPKEKLLRMLRITQNVTKHKAAKKIWGYQDETGTKETPASSAPITVEGVPEIATSNMKRPRRKVFGGCITRVTDDEIIVYEVKELARYPLASDADSLM